MQISLSYNYILVNKDERVELLIDGFAYEQLLDEAFNHGWEPAWTSEPCDWCELDYEDVIINQMATDGAWCLPGSYTYDDSVYFILDPNKTWDGNYTSSQGQEVTAQDAMAIADALQRALDSVPDYDMHMRRLTRSRITKAEIITEESYEKAGAECPGYMKAIVTEHIRRGCLLARDLQEIIAFCRKGAFLIW